VQGEDVKEVDGGVESNKFVSETRDNREGERGICEKEYVEN